MTDSDILLLDEPTVHLDASLKMALIRSVTTRAQANSVIAVALHDFTLTLCANRLWLMDGGRLLIDAEPDDAEILTALTDMLNGATAIEAL